MRRLPVSTPGQPPMFGLVMNDVVKARATAASATHVHHSPTSRTCQLLSAL